MRMEYADPAQLDEAKKKNTPIILPVGVMEYHSSHLPIGTDALVAYEFAKLLEEECDVIVAPPVWYGPASYAVKGPDGYSIDMDSMVFNQTMYNIYMSLLKSGFRNIYTIIAHQTEAQNPTETACIDAARRTLFRFLEDEQGVGWWGKPESETFYESLSAAENPWNWIKVYPIAFRDPKVPGDHAGIHETSMLWSLAPETIRVDKLGGYPEDWFARTSKDASKEIGDKDVQYMLQLWKEEFDKYQ